jgi:hypothetical protein
VGILDNVVRAYVLNSDTKLHPLLAFISVLGGLQVLGLWGVFIGPIVASCLHALVQIFNHELVELSRERFGLDPAPEGAPPEGAPPDSGNVPAMEQKAEPGIKAPLISGDDSAAGEEPPGEDSKPGAQAGSPTKEEGSERFSRESSRRLKRERKMRSKSKRRR